MYRNVFMLWLYFSIIANMEEKKNTYNLNTKRSVDDLINLFYSISVFGLGIEK